MKNIKVMIASAMLVCLALSSFGQAANKVPATSAKKPAKLDKASVPQKVTERFIVQYPGSAYDYWFGYPAYDNLSEWYEYEPSYYTTSTPENYVVEFSTKNTPYKAVYNKSGAKLATHKILATNLPAAVSSAINAGSYKTWTQGKDKEEIFKDSDADQLKIYRVCVSKGTEKHTLYYDKAGKLVKDKKTS
jgi:hypothetical protein